MLDGKFSDFLNGLQNLEQLTKNCVELRGEYVELIPSLVVVASALPGQAKNILAPLLQPLFAR